MIEPITRDLTHYSDCRLLLLLLCFSCSPCRCCYCCVSCCWMQRNILMGFVLRTHAWPPFSRVRSQYMQHIRMANLLAHEWHWPTPNYIETPNSQRLENGAYNSSRWIVEVATAPIQTGIHGLAIYIGWTCAQMPNALRSKWNFFEWRVFNDADCKIAMTLCIDTAYPYHSSS